MRSLIQVLSALESENTKEGIVEMDKFAISDLISVRLSDAADALILLDQTKLPGEVVFLRPRAIRDIWTAIRQLQVRGAPAIGIAAALGLYLHVKAEESSDFPALYRRLDEGAAFLETARPTAVNLSWAMERMRNCAKRSSGLPIPEVKQELLREAEAIRTEDERACLAIGEYGLSLLSPGDGILTHCNAGQLATARYGTATAPIYLGQDRGYNFRVFADETRPLLQGARLTAFELMTAGVDVTLICDNMSGLVMKKGLIRAVLVGGDRVAANGDTANKIGTSMVAALAKRNHVPFYVCVPSSTIDLSTPTGAEIPIEERDGAEVTHMWFAESVSPSNVKVYNPAFDVTDHDLIDAIITEHGIARPPYETSLRSTGEV
jgi:methylthioribose-1-phosphate isomerase